MIDPREALSAKLLQAADSGDSDRGTSELMREAAALLLSPVEVPTAPDAPHVREDYIEVWQSGWRAGYRAALLLSEAHRCSGCNLRWEGPLHGAELCGDCWRKAQPVLLSEAAPPKQDEAFFRCVVCGFGWTGRMHSCPKCHSGSVEKNETP